MAVGAAANTAAAQQPQQQQQQPPPPPAPAPSTDGQGGGPSEQCLRSAWAYFDALTAPESNRAAALAEEQEQEQEQPVAAAVSRCFLACNGSPCLRHCGHGASIGGGGGGGSGGVARAALQRDAGAVQPTR
eukprot:COSAG01_NODE_2761_length_7116_cov_27.151489_6_plen_131_part_00